MKTFLLIFFLALVPSAFGQYVAQNIQQRIQNDQATIAHDKSEIQAMYADINGIVQDNSADTVTSTIPEVATIQATQAAAVSANIMSANTEAPAI